MTLFERVIAAALTILVGLVAWVLLAPPVLIDVEIYEHRESGVIFYCATGSLTPDPPWRYVSSGAVKDGLESYC